MWSWWRAHYIPWTTRKMDRWVLEHSHLETSPEAARATFWRALGKLTAVATKSSNSLWLHSPKQGKQELSRYLYPDIPWSVISGSQKVKTAQVSINRYVDKQKRVFTVNGISFSVQIEEDSDTHYHMHEAGDHGAQRNKPHTKRDIFQDCMYRMSPKGAMYIKTESRRWVHRAGGDVGSQGWMGTAFHFGKTRKFWR